MEKAPSPVHKSSKTAPVAEHAATPHDAPVAPMSATSGKHGQELLARVQSRKAELHLAVTKMRAASPKGAPESEHAKEIDKALAAVETLLTGDLDQISAANASDLSVWLTSSANLTSHKSKKH